MPAVDLSEFRLIRVEYDPYEQGLEEDEEYDFDFEPDPDQLYIRVRAFWKFIASKTSQRSNSLGARLLTRGCTCSQTVDIKIIDQAEKQVGNARFWLIDRDDIVEQYGDFVGLLDERSSEQ